MQHLEARADGTGRQRQGLDRLVTDLLRSGQAVRFKVSGMSMYPAVRDGEILVAKPVDPATLRRGDVGVFLSNDALRVHRIVHVPGSGRDAFLFRGDASLTCDAPVAADQILGQVISIRRGQKDYSIIGPGYRFRSCLYAGLWRLKTRIVQEL
jgi:signal peptidase I